tara:strand:+ start:174 stop:413 length:240 start_codon:yes stop_codon:yes gene_type:complete
MYASGPGSHAGSRAKEDNMEKKIKVTLVWGSGYDVEKTYEFASPAEKDAFMKGVDEAIGWMDYGEKEELVAEGKLKQCR